MHSCISVPESDKQAPHLHDHAACSHHMNATSAAADRGPARTITRSRAFGLALPVRMDVNLSCTFATLLSMRSSCNSRLRQPLHAKVCCNTQHKALTASDSTSTSSASSVAAYVRCRLLCCLTQGLRLGCSVLCLHCPHKELRKPACTPILQRCRSVVASDDSPALAAAWAMLCTDSRSLAPGRPRAPSAWPERRSMSLLRVCTEFAPCPCCPQHLIQT